MDPDANLKEQLELADAISTAAEAGFESPEDAWRLAELVLALNEWIKKGGFLPAAWSRKK